MKRTTTSRLTSITKRTGLAPVFFVSLLVTGCSTIPASVSDYGALGGPLELVDTPFYPQEAYQCGPAALLTVLTESGVDTTIEELVDRVYVPARRGSLQSEILAATRAAERLPYVVDPALSAITAELAAGRPVLILQNLSISWAPLWHYAVVIGVDPHRDEIVLRSGTDERRIMRTAVFLRTWRRSNYWGIVTLRPGELPANPDRDRYARAVAALEQTGHHHSASASWRAGAARWPDDPVQLFGLANADHALGNLAEAEVRFRQLLEKDPAFLGARNNLAMTLLAQGRHAEALAQIDHALEDAGESPLRVNLLETRNTILGVSGQE